jgi:hypothetical protein
MSTDIAVEWATHPERVRELLEERAAIIEYEAGIDRREAEILAELEVLYGSA